MSTIPYHFFWNTFFTHSKISFKIIMLCHRIYYPFIRLKIIFRIITPCHLLSRTCICFYYFYTNSTKKISISLLSYYVKWDSYIDGLTSFTYFWLFFLNACIHAVSVHFGALIPIYWKIYTTYVCMSTLQNLVKLCS